MLEWKSELPTEAGRYLRTTSDGDIRLGVSVVYRSQVSGTRGLCMATYTGATLIASIKNPGQWLGPIPNPPEVE